jgi:hypothetical protein
LQASRPAGSQAWRDASRTAEGCLFSFFIIAANLDIMHGWDANEIENIADVAAKPFK